MAKVSCPAWIHKEHKTLLEGFAAAHGDIGISDGLSLLLTRPDFYIAWLEKQAEVKNIR